MPTVRKQSRKSSKRGSRSRSASQPRGLALLSGAAARLGARVEYRIYPSIGVARVGDCLDSFLIGPEAPGVVPAGPFRGKDRGIKPQAARFRIYKVQVDASENETVIEEVVRSNDIEIAWSVSLANRKAAGFKIKDTLAREPKPASRNGKLDRKKLVIAAAGTVSGSATAGPVLSGAIEFAKPGQTGPKVTDIVLATLRTDDSGRLLVVGGPGKSGSPLNAPINSFSDNDGWYDSASDGPVSATLRIKGKDETVIPAWVVVTVPRFAPAICGIVTWYDRAVSMARMGAGGLFSFPRSTSFTKDIYPILKRADDLAGVHGVAHSKGSLAPLSDAARIAALDDPNRRKALQQKLTASTAEAPAAQERPFGTMPQLFSGANPDPDGPVWTYLGLTKYQTAHIENWVNGNFDADWPGSEPAPVPFDEIPVARQAWALCEAALENCVGGSFYPGIEASYDIARVETYHPKPNLRRELRINPAHPVGFLTEKMALPWQADFADCANFWWPSQRPDDVTTKAGQKVRWDRGVTGPTMNGHLNMVNFWSRLGFVIRDPATKKFVEDEDRRPF